MSKLQQLSARNNQKDVIQRWTVLGAIGLCVLVCGLIADSLLSAWKIPVGDPAARGWQWLLGGPEQTFRGETIALLAGSLLLGVTLGGLWFLAAVGLNWLRDWLAVRR